MGIPKIYIGTAGWFYKDWLPNFYPKSQSKNFDWLEYYAQFFNLVEVNSTFYTYLKNEIAKRWIDKVSDNKDFIFSMKLHGDFTHHKNYNAGKIKTTREMLDILSTNEKLAGLLIQFPYSFQCNQQNIEHVSKLVAEFEQYTKFVELRHASWLNKNPKTITFCSIDQPQIGESAPFKVMTGNNMSYLRFHGRNTDEWKKSISNFGKEQTYTQQNERYNYLYSPGELTEFEMQIKEVYDKVNKIYMIMNNHPNGKAVVNAFELIHMLNGKQKIVIPETSLKVFPRLQNVSIK